MRSELEAYRKFADIDGSQMSYLDIGKGDVLVLCHGYLFDADMWLPQIYSLSSRYRLIVPELWGHGESGALPVGTRNLRQIADHHLQLLDGLGIGDFAIAGLCAGGMWAAELAIAAPERVNALALICTSAGAEPIYARNLYVSMLDAIDSLGAVPEGIVEALLPKVFSRQAITERPHLVEQFRQRLRRADRRNVIDTLVPMGRMIFGRRDVLADLEGLSMPAIVISGELDRTRPIHEGRLMAEALECLFIALSGTGHIASLEAAEDISLHLHAFLANRVPRRKMGISAASGRFAGPL